MVANNFVIRTIDPVNHPADFLFSSNLFSVAERNGWWSPNPNPTDPSNPNPNLLNFLQVFAPGRMHPNYMHRRVWRVFSLANPGHPLPADTGRFAPDYPFRSDQP